VDEVGSRPRAVTLSGGKFSEVRARCTSGRRCTTSVTATEVGSGGRGTFGGGTGGGLRSARRGRIAPPILPLRERPPPIRLGTSPYPSPSVDGRSTGRISVLPLRTQPPGLMSAVRCKARPALRCGLLRALSPLFATHKLLRRRRKRGVLIPEGIGDVALALLDARLRGMKSSIASSEDEAGIAFNFVGVVSESLSMFMEQSGIG